jgi:hypothetical protein
MQGQVFLAISDDWSAAAPAPTNNAAPPRRRFCLDGPSVALEPGRYAIRRDLAEIDVADRVFAQHYAEPMRYRLTQDVDVRRRPQADADARGHLRAGDPFDVFDIGRDWAWGRGAEGPVGYVACSALERA